MKYDITIYLNKPTESGAEKLHFCAIEESTLEGMISEAIKNGDKFDYREAV